MNIERVIVSAFDVSVARDQLAGHAPLPLADPSLQAPGAMGFPTLHRRIVGLAPVATADGGFVRFAGGPPASHFWRGVAEWAAREPTEPRHAVLPVGVAPPAVPGQAQGIYWMWPFGGAGEISAERQGPMDLNAAIVAASELSASLDGRSLGALRAAAQQRLWPGGTAPRGRRVVDKMVVIGLVAASGERPPPFRMKFPDRQRWEDVDRAAAFSALFGQEVAVPRIGDFSTRTMFAEFKYDSFALMTFDQPRALVFLTQRSRAPGGWTRCCVSNVGHCMMLAHVLAYARLASASGEKPLDPDVYRTAGRALAELPGMYTRESCAALIDGSSLLKGQCDPPRGEAKPADPAKPAEAAKAA